MVTAAGQKQGAFKVDSN